LPLIYVQERTGGPELVGRNHEMAASGEIRIEYIYTVRIPVSSINLDAKYINRKFGRLQQTALETCTEFSRRMRKLIRNT
jgi:hypothetical protein